MSKCRKRIWIKAPALGVSTLVGPPGPPGPPGAGVELPLSTDDVDYRGLVLTDVIDSLLYVPLTINSFNGSSTFERGQVLTSLAVTWSYNKPVQAQSITGSGVIPPILAAADRNVTLTLENVSTNRTITLTADDITGDATPPKTRTLSLAWYDGVYWGVATPGTYNSAFISGLANKQLRGSRQGSFNINVGAGQYGFVAIPQDMGAASFKTNGFNGGLSLQAVISYTNAFGFTKNYNLYRTENTNLGLTAVEIL